MYYLDPVRKNKNGSVAPHIKCRQLPVQDTHGAATRVAATYLNKTSDRAAIRPLPFATPPTIVVLPPGAL